MVKFTRAVAQRMLGNVPQDKQFWCSDGRVLKSLPELEVALREMSEETFRNHSSEVKSDFSIWVNDVIGDEKLANDLRKSTTRAQAAKNVASRIGWLRGKMSSG